MSVNNNGSTNNGLQQDDSLYVNLENIGNDNSNQGNDSSVNDSGNDNSNNSVNDSGNDNSNSSVNDSGNDNSNNSVTDSGNDNSNNSVNDSGNDNSNVSIADSGNDNSNNSVNDSGNDNSDNSNQGNNSGNDNSNSSVNDSGNDNSNTDDDSRSWQGNNAFAMGENIADSFNDNSNNSVADSGNDNSNNSVNDSGNDNSDHSNQGNNSGNDNSDNSNQGNDSSTNTDIALALDVAIADAFNTDNSDNSNQGNNSGNDNSDNSNQGNDSSNSSVNDSGNDNSTTTVSDSGNDNSTNTDIALELNVAIADAFNDKSVNNSFNDLSTSFGKIDVNFESVFNGAFGDGNNNTAFAVSQVADIVDHDTLENFSQHNNGTFNSQAYADDASVSGSWDEIGSENGNNGVADVTAIADARASSNGTAFNMEVVMGANLQQNAFTATVIGGDQDNDTTSGDSF